jgi:COMPASS component SWD3
MILQYLSDEGYYASRAVVHDEANVKWKEREERGIEAKRLKQAILGSCCSQKSVFCRSIY